jgi:hypothetical protein
MKTRWMILFVAIVGATIALATVFQVNTSPGRRVTATTAPQQIIFTENGQECYATEISVFNAGTSTVFGLVNCLEDVFTNAVNAGTTTPIRPNMANTFRGSRLFSLWLQTTNGTAEVDISTN